MKNLAFIIFLGFLLSVFHPVHVSVTNIEYSAKEQKFDISLRLFLDDFEHIITQKYGVALNIGKENELKNSNEYINKYINDNFSVKFNGKNINDKKLILKKKKIEDVTVWLYYEIKYKPVLKNVEIKNSLMTDLYRDQKNLLIFTYKKKQKALTFNKKNMILDFSF